MEARPDDGSHRRRLDPHRVVEGEGAQRDPGVVEDWGQRVEQEPALRDQDLAQCDGGREQDGGHEHQPEQVEVERLLRIVEARGDEAHGGRGNQEQQQARGRHDEDGEREHGLGEPRGAVRIVPAQGAEDGDEGSRQPRGDQDVEGKLRQDKGGVVGVKLRTRPVRASEQAVPEEPGEVRREGQDREQDGALGQEPPQQCPDPRHRPPSPPSCRGRSTGPVTPEDARMGRYPVGAPLCRAARGVGQQGCGRAGPSSGWPGREVA